MTDGEVEIGLRELGKSVQDTLLSFFCNNMGSAYDRWMETSTVLAHFDGDYHIDVVLRTIYPSYEGTDPDIIDKQIFRFYATDEECINAHHAIVTVILYADESGTITKQGGIQIKIEPILLLSPDFGTFAPTDFFDDLLEKIHNGRTERGH